MIKLDIKTILPYLVLIGTMLITWGMWSERLNAVEQKQIVLQNATRCCCYKSTNSSN